MGALNAVLRLLKAHYDKLIAFGIMAALLGSLLYLAVEIGRIKDVQDDFQRNIENLRPRYPAATPVDPAPYDAARRAIDHPAQVSVEAWKTNSLLVPEKRVWCVDCRSPIPYAAEVCLRCNVRQPPLPDNVWDRPDTDRDGIPDKWEVHFGLDPNDPRDAMADMDGDGFSNLAEFSAEPRTDIAKGPKAGTPGTDMKDPASFPPPEAELCLLKIVADPFNFLFMSVSEMPDKTLKFAINTRARGKTYFKKLKEDVEGFVLERYEKKTAQRRRPGVETVQNVDASELTLSKNGKTIVLVLGETVPYSEKTARMLFRIDRSEYTVKEGQELKARFGNNLFTYKVMGIDTDAGSVVIERADTGRRWTVRKCLGSQDLAGEGGQAPVAAHGESAR